MATRSANRPAATTHGPADAPRSRRKLPKQELRPLERPRKQRKNLTLDADVIAGGEQYGKRHGTNLSQLVNGFLRALLTRAGAEETAELAAELTPTVSRLYGAAAGATTDRDAHRAHLLDKYGSRG